MTPRQVRRRRRRAGSHSVGARAPASQRNAGDQRHDPNAACAQTSSASADHARPSRRFDNRPPSGGRGDDNRQTNQRIGEKPVMKMHRSRSANEGRPNRSHPVVGRGEAPSHQRPVAFDKTGLGAGDERSGEALDERRGRRRAPRPTSSGRAIDALPRGDRPRPPVPSRPGRQGEPKARPRCAANRSGGRKSALGVRRAPSTSPPALVGRPETADRYSARSGDAVTAEGRAAPPAAPETRSRSGGRGDDAPTPTRTAF